MRWHCSEEDSLRADNTAEVEQVQKPKAGTTAKTTMQVCLNIFKTTRFIRKCGRHRRARRYTSKREHTEETLLGPVINSFGWWCWLEAESPLDAFVPEESGTRSRVRVTQLEAAAKINGLNECSTRWLYLSTRLSEKGPRTCQSSFQQKLSKSLDATYTKKTAAGKISPRYKTKTAQ